MRIPLPQPVRLFRGTEWTLAATVALSVLQSALLIPIAGLTQHIFDVLIPDGRTTALVASGLLILALYLLGAGVGLVNRYFVQRAVKASIARFRLTILSHVYRLPQSYFDRAELGRLHSSIVLDTERVDCMASSLASDLLPSTIVAVALAGVLVYLNATLFAILLAVVPLMLLVSRFLGRQVRVHGAAWQGAFDTFSSQTLLALRAMSLTRIHGAEEIDLAVREEEVRELSRTGLNVTWRSTAYSIVQGTVATAAGVVVLILGGAAVADHRMTIGELLSFYAIVALLLRQLRTIVSSVPVITIGRMSLKRLDRLTADAPAQPYSGTKRHRFEGAVALDDVSFAYDAEPVLSGVTLAVERSEHVAIVGPNGAGKSTLLNLLLALYRPLDGVVSADGIPYDRLDVAHLRTQLGVVLQDPILLPGTIAENIAYGRPGASRDDIRRAAEYSTAQQFVEQLPLGYDTVVGDDGQLLSGGQRQRIAIARALMGRPALIVLDEPTSHLDDASISALVDNLRRLPGSPTVIVITHDPAIAAQTDRTYYLRDGVLLDYAAELVAP